MQAVKACMCDLGKQVSHYYVLKRVTLCERNSKITAAISLVDLGIWGCRNFSKIMNEHDNCNIFKTFTLHDSQDSRWIFMQQ